MRSLGWLLNLEDLTMHNVFVLVKEGRLEVRIVDRVALLCGAIIIQSRGENNIDLLTSSQGIQLAMEVAHHFHFVVLTAGYHAGHWSMKIERERSKRLVDAFPNTQGRGEDREEVMTLIGNTEHAMRPSDAQSPNTARA